ncbi:MAG: SAM-dependent methyltransferase [Lachnospiraceae bacterium]|nr:SAM-dependent methyltransferase [Lachnospiraceae bacterium]
MKISDRLKKIADFVGEGNILADIGTDHGYVPIYLVKNNIIPSAFAMDVKAGPLERAAEHIEEYGLRDKIQLRLSDGLKMLNKNEAESILIAGMGGALTVQILRQGRDILDTAKELIVSPQSEINLVREYLLSINYKIVREEMIKDAGKYYVIMKWIKGNGDEIHKYSQCELLYGRMLLINKNKVLLEYLVNERNTYSKILKSLQDINGEEIISRKKELNEKLSLIGEAMRFYD